MQTYLKNGYIVTMGAEETVYDGGGVLIEGEDIIAVGKVDPQLVKPDAEVIDLQGSQPRAYFAYYPNQYGDGKSWLQMTLIFARPGSEEAGLSLADATPAPHADEEYEGYFSQDNYSHFEIFATPTPEPDSAAMEGWH